MASVWTTHCSINSESNWSSLSAWPSINCWNAPSSRTWLCEDNVVFDARHNAIHDAAGLLRLRNRRRVRRKDRSHEPDENEYGAPHQNVVPRLIKNWKPGSLDSVVRHAAVEVGGHVPLYGVRNFAGLS